MIKDKQLITNITINRYLNVSILELSLKYFDLIYLCKFNEIKYLKRRFKVYFSLRVIWFVCDFVDFL